MLLDTSQLPRDRAASGTQSAGLPRGGPWGPPEHIPTRTAALPRPAGPPPRAAAAGTTGRLGSMRARGGGSRTGHAPKPWRTTRGTQRAGLGWGSAGLETQTLPRRTPGRPHSLPPKTIVLQPAPFPRTEGEGVFRLLFFSLNLCIDSGVSEPRASRSTPCRGLRKPKVCPRPGQRCALRSFFSC